MSKYDEVIQALRSAKACKVIHKETANSYIVETEDGQHIDIETALPDVYVGVRGKVFRLNNQWRFLREPYRA